jgi:hypothetical protein
VPVGTELSSAVTNTVPLAAHDQCRHRDLFWIDHRKTHASFQQKNYALVYHVLWGFFTQRAPIYRG